MNALSSSAPRRGVGQRLLDGIEWAGNKLPDPAVLFLLALVLTWGLSAALAPVQFTEIDPRTVVRDAAGHITTSAPIQVKNQLSGAALTQFLSRMVKTFTEFPPLGVVLVAMLGVGVAEHTGIGTLMATMLPYSVAFLVTWTVLLLIYWGLGLPLGLQSTYTHP